MVTLNVANELNDDWLKHAYRPGGIEAYRRIEKKASTEGMAILTIPLGGEVGKLGSSKSGFYGHSGIPGKRGGSAARSRSVRISPDELETVSATPENAEAIFDEVRAWEDKRGRIARDATMLMIQGGDGFIFKHQGEVVGVAATEMLSPEIMYLNDFATKRPGIGRTAMYVVGQEAYNQGADLILNSLEPAKVFYEKLGLTPSGEYNQYTWSHNVLGDTLKEVGLLAEVVDDEPEDGAFASHMVKGVHKLGSKKSGHWGHAGRPGKRGGSVSRSTAMSIRTGKEWQARQQWKGEREGWPEAKTVEWLDARTPSLDFRHGDFNASVEYKDGEYKGSWYSDDETLRPWHGEAVFKNAEDAQRWVEETGQIRIKQAESAFTNQGIITGNDPAKITSAIEGHAESAEFPVKVETMKVVGDVPAGWQEHWHGTSRDTAELIEQSGLRASDSGAFGPGVYLAPGANKSVAYASEQYGADNGAMVRVAADPGKILNLTPETQVKVNSFIEPYRARINTQKMKALEQYEKTRDVSFLDRASALDLLESESKSQVYAREHGYNSIRFAPPSYTNPIVQLSQPRNKINFKNEELLILDPSRVQVVAIAGIKHE